VEVERVLDDCIAYAERLKSMISSNGENADSSLGGDMLPNYKAARNYQLRIIQEILRNLRSYT
jgi:hypothetical protein